MPNHWCWRSWSWPVLWRPTRSFRTNTKKKKKNVLTFHHRGLECKSSKSRDTQSNRQVWSWRTKWSREKANRVLSRENIGHSKHHFPITQETAVHMDITKWSIPKPDWLYCLQLKMEKFCTVSKNKTWSWLWLTLWAPYCEIQTKLKKTGKTTSPFRYDLNKILYDYTVEVRNRFKGLDLVDRVLKNYEQRFITLYRRQWPKPSQRKRNARRQNGCLRRLYK